MGCRIMNTTLIVSCTVIDLRVSAALKDGLIHGEVHTPVLPLNHAHA